MKYALLTAFLLSASFTHAQSDEYLTGYGIFVQTDCDSTGVTICREIGDTTCDCEMSYTLQFPSGELRDIVGIVSGSQVCYQITGDMPLGKYVFYAETFPPLCWQTCWYVESQLHFFWSGCIDYVCGERFFSGNAYKIGPVKDFQIPANAKQVVCGIQSSMSFCDTIELLIDGESAGFLTLCDTVKQGSYEGKGPLVYENGNIVYYDDLSFPHYDSLGLSGSNPSGVALFTVDIPDNSCSVIARLKTTNGADYSQTQIFFRCFEYDEHGENAIDTIDLYGCTIVTVDGSEYTSDTVVFTQLWEDPLGCIKSLYHRIHIGVGEDIIVDEYVCPGGMFEGVTIMSDTSFVQEIYQNNCFHNLITEVHVLPVSTLSSSILPKYGASEVIVEPGTAIGAYVSLDGTVVETCWSPQDCVFTIKHSNGNHIIRVDEIGDFCLYYDSEYFIQKDDGTIIVPQDPGGDGGLLIPSIERSSGADDVKLKTYNIMGQEVVPDNRYPGMYFVRNQYGKIVRLVTY